METIICVHKNKKCDEKKEKKMCFQTKTAGKIDTTNVSQSNSKQKSVSEN
jgi:hypothetical protein